MTNTLKIIEALTNYIYDDVPLEDFETADELKDSLMEMLYAMVDAVVDDNFDFENAE